MTLILLSLPGPANASTSFPVTLEVQTVFIEPENPFIAYGPAVDEGLICPSGTVTQGKLIAAERPNGWNFRIEKIFNCADGSGSFIINLKAHLIFDPYSDTGNWNVLSGEDTYTTLHGRGSLLGIPFGEGEEAGVLDIYAGFMHLE